MKLAYPFLVIHLQLLYYKYFINILQWIGGWENGWEKGRKSSIDVDMDTYMTYLIVTIF